MNRADDIVIRLAREDDAPALARLAVLDEAPLPAGEHMVAEVRGELWAALPLGGGGAFADPFRPSGDLVELLRAWASRRADDQQARTRGRAIHALSGRGLRAPRPAEGC